MDSTRAEWQWQSMREHYPGHTDEQIQRYFDLRDEGYQQHQAELMAGLTNPPDGDQ